MIDKTFSLPIINAAATEWPTLVTALDQLTRLNAVVYGANSTLVVSFDMNLYKRVVKLEYLHTEFKNKWVFSPGGFHTVHEFAYTNKVLMAPGGSIHPTTDKSTVIKLLEDLVTNDTAQTSA